MNSPSLLYFIMYQVGHTTILTQLSTPPSLAVVRASRFSNRAMSVCC